MTDTADAATNAAGVAAPAVNAPQVTESAPVANDAGTAPKPDDGFTRRIDELTKIRRDEERARQAAERDRDHWREMALRHSQRQEPEKADTGPKSLADFEYDDVKYQSYLFQEAEKRAVSAAEKRLREQQENEKSERRVSTFKQRITEFSKSVKDFEEKVFADSNPVSPAMREIFEESEEGPALAYYLANNRDIAIDIARLSEKKAAHALGRIEERLIAERQKPVKKVSDAPAPPPKLDGSGDPKIDKDPKDMNQSEFEKWRKKFISARR